MAITRSASWFSVTMYLAAVGENVGFWQVQYPYTGESFTRQTAPYSEDRFYIRKEIEINSEIENKTFIVHASNTINIACTDGNQYYNGIAFSPLPISALGKKYIVPSCHDPYVNTSLLVVATASEMTDVVITFRLGDQSIIYDGRIYHNGDILKVRLFKYQTLTIRTSSSLCGTVVSADVRVAVYSGTDNPVSYMQILPVRLHGQQYVAAVGQRFRYNDDDVWKYYVLIVGEKNNTQIMSDNRHIPSVGQRNFYRMPLVYNESIFFSTSRPVMVSLCLYNNRIVWTRRSHLVCSIIPPVSLYTKATAFVSLRQGDIKILRAKSADELHVKKSIGRSWVEVVSTEWTDIPNSKYKVGTCLTSGTEIFYIDSNTIFTVLGYGYNYHAQFIFNVGYSFHRRGTEITRLPDPSTESPIQGGISSKVDVTLAVGVTCGLIIMVLVIVIAGLVIYIRRRVVGARGTDDDQQRENPSCRDQPRLQETTC